MLSLVIQVWRQFLFTSVDFHLPSLHGNAEVTNWLFCKPLKCQIPSRFWSQRFGCCWHLTRHFSVCVIRRNLRTPGKKHFGAAVSLQLKNNPFRIGLGLHCFALLSLSIFAGAKAAGLAALVPREYCWLPVKAVLLAQEQQSGFFTPLVEQSK